MDKYLQAGISGDAIVWVIVAVIWVIAQAVSLARKKSGKPPPAIRLAPEDSGNRLQKDLAELFETITGTRMAEAEEAPKPAPRVRLKTKPGAKPAVASRLPDLPSPAPAQPASFHVEPYAQEHSLEPLTKAGMGGIQLLTRLGAMNFKPLKFPSLGTAATSRLYHKGRTLRPLMKTRRVLQNAVLCRIILESPRALNDYGAQL